MIYNTSKRGYCRNEYWDNGDIRKRTYYRNELIHREDKPAIIEYSIDGSLYKESYYIDGILHRDFGPSVVRYLCGKIRGEIYYINGVKSRGNNLPSELCYQIDSRKVERYYSDNISKHRIDGPFEIYYNKDGSIENELWYYKNVSYTIQVHIWLHQNNFKSWEDMTLDNFNRMWMEIL